MEPNEEQMKSYLRRIADILLINGGLLESPGLYSGDTGLAVFFCHYAEFTGNDLYLDYSIDLIDSLRDRISRDTPVGYGEGLTGIGSAVEYLSQAGYIEADTDGLLEEFDDRIFSLGSLPELSADDVWGTAYYAIWRMQGSRTKKDSLLDGVLPKICVGMDGWFTRRKIENRLVPYVRDIMCSEADARRSGCPALMRPWHNLYCRENPYVPLPETPEQMPERIFRDDLFSPQNLNFGYPCGLAAAGMTLLTELGDGGLEWISLFPGDITPPEYEPLPL
jgi:hypothetical protein